MQRGEDNDNMLENGVIIHFLSKERMRAFVVHQDSLGEQKGFPGLRKSEVM